MKKDLPKLKIKKTYIDYTFIIINCALMLFNIIYPVVYYDELPNSIPSEFNS